MTDTPTETLTRLVAELNALHDAGRWPVLERGSTGLHYVDGGPRDAAPEEPLPPVDKTLARQINPKYLAEIDKHIKRCEDEVSLMAGSKYTRTIWVHERSAHMLKQLRDFVTKPVVQP